MKKAYIQIRSLDKDLKKNRNYGRTYSLLIIPYINKFGVGVSHHMSAFFIWGW